MAERARTIPMWRKTWGAYAALGRSILGVPIRKIQTAPGYRRLARGLKPDFTISEAGEAELTKLFPYEAAPLLRPEATFYLARCKKTIAGVVHFVRHPPEDFPFVGHWFSDLKIWPLWRRMGLGEALVQKVIDRAREEDAPELFCLVFEDNLPARNLYGKLGFHRVVLPALEAELQKDVPAWGKRRVMLRKALT